MESKVDLSTQPIGFAFDVFPKEIDTAETFRATACLTLKLMEISERLDSGQIEAMLKQRNPVVSMLYLYSKL
jgi:hypothetical protein